MTMWMVRAGTNGTLFPDFVEKGFVAIGWEVGDLNQFKSRQMILDAVLVTYPQISASVSTTYTGMLHRFANVMHEGDGVISYDPSQRVYAVGKLEGDYLYDPKNSHPHIRKVDWAAKELSRDTLSTSTKNSLGSNLTLFQVRESAAADVRRVVEGKGHPEGIEELPDAETSADDEQSLLEDLESRSIEFIKDSINELDWEEMQSLVAGVLRAMGYKTRISARGPDRGVDILASRDGFGFDNPRIVVEVKHRSGPVGAPLIRSFVGGRHVDDKCLYVSTGGFSREAKYEADRANVLVTLLDLHELAETVVENYESLDDETRRLVPLRRIYWPAGRG